ncbi:MAG TPA: FAD binding domain-containing protein [Ktedonobacteraceae bacterium]|jgi:CO/xanthine dehydrogenase FAD-binding subunit|nr:FAD binding domain-containing protein [Ktedonobacteraceae bacterium]
MLLNLLEYNWPEDIDQTLLLLARNDTKTVPLAGGTYLLGLVDDTIQAVVDLRDLELAYISEDVRGVHIGAMTTLQAMVDSPLLKEFAVGLLSRAAQVSSSSRVIRESATLGGTLAAGIASRADLLTALAILDTEVVLRSASKTQVNLGAGTAERPGLALSGVTFKGKQERRVACNFLSRERRASELIIEVIVARPNYTCGTSFLRVGRTPTDIALLNVAALVEIKDGIYNQVRLALGGVNMEPVRLQAVEKQLVGQHVEAATVPQNGGKDNPFFPLERAVEAGMAEFRPPSDFRASSDYRHESGMRLAYRALEEAANISRWRGMAGRNQSAPYGRS